jgi:hypothetical protein
MPVWRRSWKLIVVRGQQLSVPVPLADAPVEAERHDRTVTEEAGLEHPLLVLATKLEKGSATRYLADDHGYVVA